LITRELSVMRRLLDNPRRRLNILTHATHEGFSGMLASIPHNFYMLSGAIQGGPPFKKWDYHTRPMPPNHYMFNIPAEHTKADIEFDLVLCQNRSMYYPFFFAVAEKLNIPLIVLDHTEPPPGASQQQLNGIKQWIGHTNVYITEHNRTTWENPNGIIIPHGIDTEVFKGYTGALPRGVTMVNQFPSRDVFCGWGLYQSLLKQIQCDLVGDNPGLSKSIKDPVEIASTLGQYRYYLNTSQLSPVPLSVLEAMAIGLPIVTTAKQELPKIIRNGYNGYISNDPEELIKACQKLVAEPELAKELGANARKTIEEKFSLQNFVENWNNVFYNTLEKI